MKNMLFIFTVLLLAIGCEGGGGGASGGSETKNTDDTKKTRNLKIKGNYSLLSILIPSAYAESSVSEYTLECDSECSIQKCAKLYKLGKNSEDLICSTNVSGNDYEFNLTLTGRNSLPLRVKIYDGNKLIRKKVIIVKETETDIEANLDTSTSNISEIIENWKTNNSDKFWEVVQKVKLETAIKKIMNKVCPLHFNENNSLHAFYSYMPLLKQTDIATALLEVLPNYEDSDVDQKVSSLKNLITQKIECGNNGVLDSNLRDINSSNGELRGYPTDVRPYGSGKFLVLMDGYKDDSNTSLGRSHNIAVLNKYGYLEKSNFGGDGVVRISNSTMTSEGVSFTGNGVQYGAGAIIPLSDGSFYYVATVSYTDTETRVLLFKLKSDGTFDRSFSGGKSFKIIIGDKMSLVDAKKNSDGDLIISCTERVKTSYMQGPNKVMLYKFDSSGTVVSGFGSSGSVVVKPTPEANADILYGSDILLDTNGDIVVPGTYDAGFFVAKVTPSGSVDTSFGSQGYLTIRHSDYSSIGNSFSRSPFNILFEDSSGNYFASFYMGGGYQTYNNAVVGMSSSGALISGFNGGGVSSISSYSSNAEIFNPWGIMSSSGGGGLVYGDMKNGSTTRWISFIKFDSVGRRDTTFYDGGIYIYKPDTSQKKLYPRFTFTNSDGSKIIFGLEYKNSQNYFMTKHLYL